MSNSPTVKVPRHAATPATPTPLDPVKEARARLETQPVASSFVQQVRQQMVLLDGEITRLEDQIAALTHQLNDRQSQRKHLTGYLTVAGQDAKES